MKKYIYILIFITTCTINAYSTDTTTCKVVFYREKNFTEMLTSFKIYSNDTLIAKLKNNSYFEYNCRPGQYTFTIDKLQKTQLILNTHSGNTYYILLTINTNMWSTSTQLIMVDSAMAERRISSNNLKKTEIIKLPYIRPRNRIGINIGFGTGFSNIALFNTTNAKESTISFGGGIRWGLKYGYEVDKQLDLSFEFNQQQSSLQPYLDNATTSFYRNFISFTPALIIPIKGGDKLRFKLGAGFDYYWGCELTINSSKVPNGFNETWKYNKTSGYHGTLSYEQNINDNLSTSFDLKYYNVGYTYQSTNGNHYPTTNNQLHDTNGSGIDFIIGFYYHF